MSNEMEWDKYFIQLCEAIASKSKDPSTKVGAVIVGPDKEIRSTGWNGFPRGVNDDVNRYADREIKYPMVCHAEANAICNAARVGTPLNGCTLYVKPLFVCNECAKLIIQVGIKEIVMVKSEQLPIWQEKMIISQRMLEEAGIKWRYLTPEELYE